MLTKQRDAYYNTGSASTKHAGMISVGSYGSSS